MNFILKIVNLIYYSLYSLLVLFVYIFTREKWSENLRKKFFADFFTSQWFTEQMNRENTKLRPIWLEQLINLKPDNKDRKIKLLEIGVGAGTNFPFYPSRVKLTALDYNECFKAKFMNSLKNYPNIEFDEYLTGSMEDMHQIGDNSFDAVLITGVLCSVNDIPKGLSEIKRVLKKGGRLYFAEHVAYNQHFFWSRVQKLMNPYWKVVMFNCELTKEPWIQLEKAGFEEINFNHCAPDSMLGFVRAHLWGWAQK